MVDGAVFGTGLLSLAWLGMPATCACPVPTTGTPSSGRRIRNRTAQIDPNDARAAHPPWSIRPRGLLAADRSLPTGVRNCITACAPGVFCFFFLEKKNFFFSLSSNKSSLAFGWLVGWLITLAAGVCEDGWMERSDQCGGR